MVWRLAGGGWPWRTETNVADGTQRPSRSWVGGNQTAPESQSPACGGGDREPVQQITKPQINRRDDGDKQERVRGPLHKPVSVASRVIAIAAVVRLADTQGWRLPMGGRLAGQR